VRKGAVGLHYCWQKAPRRSPDSPYGSYEHLISDGSHFEAMEMENTTQCYQEMSERFPRIRVPELAPRLALGVV
jgi:hypothetical protein